MLLIIGCARSGTSLTTSILEYCGLNLGETNELKEHMGIREGLVKPYLASLGVDPMGQYPLPDKIRIDDDWREKVLSILGDANGYKGAKMCLMWEQWANAFPEAKWVIVRREKELIVDSCRRTSFMRKREDWGNWVDHHLKKFEEMKKHLDCVEIWPDTKPETFKTLVERVGLEWKEGAETLINPAMWHDKPNYIETLNNDSDVILKQVEENLERDLPWFMGSAGEQHAIIVGGGPSLKDCLTVLRRAKGDIFALNNAHDYLIERGITPKYHVLLDSRPENVEFVRNPKKSVTYLVAAQCHSDVFEALKGYNVILWISEMAGVQPLVNDIRDKPVVLVGGGGTVGLKAMFLTYLMGYIHHHYFGFDSSYDGEDNHAYPQPLNDRESRQSVTAAGKEFICAPWMMRQAETFQKQARKLTALGCTLKVTGYGLIPHIVQNWR